MMYFLGLARKQTASLPERSNSSDYQSYAKTFVLVTASVAFSALALRFADRIPDAIETYLFSQLRAVTAMFSSDVTVIIREGNGLTPNQMFEAVTVYLGEKLSGSAKTIDVHKSVQEEEIEVTVDANQELVDLFFGQKLRWVLVATPFKDHSTSHRATDKGIQKSETRHFELRFHKNHRDLVVKSYLPWILENAKKIRENKKVVKLHTVDYGGVDYWSCINLTHPATFDKIAMEPELKTVIIEDLNQFMGGEEYYRQTGRAWKRGYLLYGPPGTGKSSLVAAMANYLKFDVYDLELSEVQCDADLRRLLIGTKNRSIIVIEDIDCSRNPKNTDEEKITLSGLLNFVDGLWSCCGDQRIIVFTTNHKDRLDPALLRPGRMDIHIHMSYCTFNSFKTLAYNYLKIEEHTLFPDIKQLLDDVNATPAEVCGELMKFRDPDKALQVLIEFLLNH